MRYGISATTTAPADSRDWLADYALEIKGECSEQWAQVSMTRLHALNADVGGLASFTPENASKYLARIAATRTIGTRNRFLTTFSRFYKWAVRTERTDANPFAGIKQLKEAKGDKDIVYCTREERDRIIAMARASEWPDWIAVPIAFYSGMRKEEIARMAWNDVLLNERRVIVPVTKTKRRRVLPMNDALRELLESVPANKRNGYVVPIPDGMDRLFRMENLHRKIRKLNQGTGRWKKKDKNKTEAERGRSPIPDERIGWNAWRHTFGSLLAQAGVSIDKISSWMGNTPEVCRRHYAQFVPRDSHDDEIEKL